MGEIAQTQVVPRIPWRPIVAIALIALLAAATMLAVGSQQQRLPAPFGPARNGAIVFSTVAGDIVQADPESGAVTTVVAGEDAGFGSAPWFANDGTKFAFDRLAPNAVERSLMVSSADGSDVRELVGPSSPIRWFDWSPTGDRMIVLRDGDPAGVVTLVDADTGSTTTFEVDAEVRTASFRPGSDELILTAPDAAYVIGVDGSGLRTLLEDPAWLDQFSISPDGRLLAYATWVEDVAEGRIHVVEIDTGVERPIDIDPGVDYTDLNPTFTPDGTSLLLERYDAVGYRPTIVPLDGGPAIAFGASRPALTNGFLRAMSPDGKQVLVTYQNDGTTWLFDVATTDGTLLDWSPALGTAATWQRLAP